MIARLLILLLLTRIPLFGDAEQDITDLVTTLTSALSENNPQLFLKTLDHDMPAFAQIQHDVNALLAESVISCSVEVIGTTGSGTSLQSDLDWYMVVRSQQDQNLIERRRTKVTIKVEKRGKKWIVTSFNPISVFALMTAR
jgi:hypothetical protein